MSTHKTARNVHFSKVLPCGNSTARIAIGMVLVNDIYIFGEGKHEHESSDTISAIIIEISVISIEKMFSSCHSH